jgi:hypothetical protein
MRVEVLQLWEQQARKLRFLISHADGGSFRISKSEANTLYMQRVAIRFEGRWFILLSPWKPFSKKYFIQ